MAVDLSAEQQAGLKELLANLQSAQDLFRRHVLPIYEDDDRGQPSLVGTSLVVDYRGCIFLVTAKHVLRRLKPGGNLYVYSRPGERRHLGGRITWNTSDGYDVVDVGVLKLEGEGLPPYPDVNCVPLDAGLLAPATGPRDGKWYLAIGYPGTRSKVNRQSRVVRAEPYANVGPAISSERIEKLGLDPHLHVVIAFHKGRVVGASGNMQSFPDPAGMSGSPLFLIYDQEAKEEQSGAFKVAGTLIEYRAKDQILLGTDIAVAINLMGRCLVGGGSSEAVTARA